MITCRLRNRTWIIFLLLSIFLTGVTGVAAQDRDGDLKALKSQIEALRIELHQSIAEKQTKIEDLERRLETLQTKTAEKPAAASPAPPESALDRALSGLAQYQEQAKKGDLATTQVGGTTLRLMDISLDVLAAGGASTVRDESIELLQGGAHDPKNRGFTLRQVELGLQGAVDPYLTSEAYLVFHEDGVETEEAFFKTTSLPCDLQLKGGFFFTEFGIINQTHPHAWEWIDQPIVNSRFLGGDGTRAPGARLSWLTPLPWYSELFFSVQNANNETEVSFLGEREGFEATIGGRPPVDRDVRNPGDLLYLARWENSFDPVPAVTARLGVSGLFGPNNTGPDGQTRIYGADLKVKWRPTATERGWPFVVWQSEIMRRDYRADSFFQDDGIEVIDLPGETLHDWGFYTQLLYGFHRGWAAGLRYEFAGGSGESVSQFDGRGQDPFRDDRSRLAPLLAWYPTEFSRFRLQYNFDRADHLDEDSHSIWLDAEFLIGSHPAHKF